MNVILLGISRNKDNYRNIKDIKITPLTYKWDQGSQNIRGTDSRKGEKTNSLDPLKFSSLM